MKKWFISLRIILIIYVQINSLNAKDRDNQGDNDCGVSMRVIEGKYIESNNKFSFKLEFKAQENSNVKKIYLSMYDYYHSPNKSAAIINVEFYHDGTPNFVWGGSLDPPQLNFTIDFTKNNPCIVCFNPPAQMFHLYSDTRKIRFELLARPTRYLRGKINSQEEIDKSFFTGTIYSNELLVSKKSVILLPEKKSTPETYSPQELEEQKTTIPETYEQDDIIYTKGSKIPYTGKLVKYDSKGKRVSEAIYVNGKKNGLYINWDDKQKVLEMDYVNGTVNGFIKKFFPNGQMMYKRRYINANSTGELFSWYETGERKHQIKVIDTHSREEIWWNKNGNIIVQGTYIDDKPFSGTFLKDNMIETYESGKLAKTSIYENNLNDDPVNW